jgi:hypothetical protein
MFVTLAHRENKSRTIYEPCGWPISGEDVSNGAFDPVFEKKAAPPG